MSPKENPSQNKSIIQRPDDTDARVPQVDKETLGLLIQDRVIRYCHDNALDWTNDAHFKGAVTVLAQAFENGLTLVAPTPNQEQLVKRAINKGLEERKEVIEQGRKLMFQKKEDVPDSSVPIYWELGLNKSLVAAANEEVRRPALEATLSNTREFIRVHAIRERLCAQFAQHVIMDVTGQSAEQLDERGTSALIARDIHIQGKILRGYVLGAIANHLADVDPDFPQDDVFLDISPIYVSDTVVVRIPEIFASLARVQIPEDTLSRIVVSKYMPYCQTDEEREELTSLFLVYVRQIQTQSSNWRKSRGATYSEETPEYWDNVRRFFIFLPLDPVGGSAGYGFDPANMDSYERGGLPHLWKRGVEFSGYIVPSVQQLNNGLHIARRRDFDLTQTIRSGIGAWERFIKARDVAPSQIEEIKEQLRILEMEHGPMLDTMLSENEIQVLRRQRNYYSRKHSGAKLVLSADTDRRALSNFLDSASASYPDIQKFMDMRRGQIKAKKEKIQKRMQDAHTILSRFSMEFLKYIGISPRPKQNDLAGYVQWMQEIREVAPVVQQAPALVMLAEAQSYLRQAEEANEYTDPAIVGFVKKSRYLNKEEQARTLLRMLYRRALNYGSILYNGALKLQPLELEEQFLSKEYAEDSEELIAYYRRSIGSENQRMLALSAIPEEVIVDPTRYAEPIFELGRLAEIAQKRKATLPKFRISAEHLFEQLASSQINNTSGINELISVLHEVKDNPLVPIAQAEGLTLRQFLHVISMRVRVLTALEELPEYEAKRDSLQEKLDDAEHRLWLKKQYTKLYSELEHATSEHTNRDQNFLASMQTRGLAIPLARANL